MTFTKININDYNSKNDLITALTDDALTIADRERDRDWYVTANQLIERGYYSIPIMLVNAVLNGKYANSGDRTYINLKAGLANATAAAFANHSAVNSNFDIISAAAAAHSAARSKFLYAVTEIYSDRIRRATERRRDKINVISTQTLIKLYHSFIAEQPNSDIIHMCFEVVQDLHVFLLENHIDLNRCNWSVPAARSYLSSVWYDTKVSKVKTATATATRELCADGIYKTTENGDRRRVRRFRSHLLKVGQNWEFYQDRAVLSADGKYWSVLEYRSIWDVLYTTTDTLISQKRRAYTARAEHIKTTADDQTVDILESIPSAENVVDRLENREIFDRLTKVLKKQGVKATTAAAYSNFAAALYCGATQQQAAKKSGLSDKWFRVLTAKHSVAIHSILTF